MTSAGFKIPSTLGYRYKLRHKIGSGTFGYVFDAVDLNTGEIVAVKIAIANKSSKVLLQHEARICMLFGGGNGVVETGFPRFLKAGYSADLPFMVMERLGPNLDMLLRHNEARLSLKTVLILANQMLARIERFHTKGFLHRDIKPHNFTMGWGKSGFRLYLIDFGLTRRYVNSKSEHISFAVGKGLIGTPWFCSINAHDGCELSRRDDLESLFYVCLYLLRGSLPWQKVKHKDTSQWSAGIKQLKTATTSLLKTLPEEFAAFYRYIRGLEFKQRPQYPYLRRLLQQAFQRFGYTNDNMYDWVLKKDYSRSEDRELCNLLLPSPSSPRGEGGPSVLSLHVPNSRNQGAEDGSGVGVGESSGSSCLVMGQSRDAARSNPAYHRTTDTLLQPMSQSGTQFSGSFRSVCSVQSSMSLASQDSEDEESHGSTGHGSTGCSPRRRVITTNTSRLSAVRHSTRLHSFSSNPASNTPVEHLEDDCGEKEQQPQQHRGSGVPMLKKHMGGPQDASEKPDACRFDAI